MTDGTGESKQSVGAGLPADADFRLFARVAPVLPLPDGARFADPSAVAAVVAMLGSPEAFFITGTEVRSTAAHMCEATRPIPHRRVCRFPLCEGAPRAKPHTRCPTKYGIRCAMCCGCRPNRRRFRRSDGDGLG